MHFAHWKEVGHVDGSGASDEYFTNLQICNFVAK